MPIYRQRHGPPLSVFQCGTKHIRAHGNPLGSTIFDELFMPNLPLSIINIIARFEEGSVDNPTDQMVRDLDIV